MSEMVEPPTPEDWQNVLRHFNTTRERISEDVALLKQWFDQQPHLPQITQGDLLFQTLLIRSKMIVERAKRSLDSYFTLRTALPIIFTDRDPLSRDLQATMASYHWAVLPRRTKDGYRIVVQKLTDAVPQILNIQHITRVAFMMEDLFLTQIETVNCGDIAIFDCENITFAHVSTISLSHLKEFEVCTTGGYRMSVKAMHFVNPLPAISLLVSLLKTVLSSKLVARLHVHETMKSLHRHVDPELLPLEYGGAEKPLKDLADGWRRVVESNRDSFLEKEIVEKVDESKRLGESVDTNALFGMVGTFRSLAVD